MFPFFDVATIFDNPFTAALGLAWLGFVIWMLADAYRRHAEYYWFWIILGIQPVGAIAYFLVVALPTLRLPRSRTGDSHWQRKLSVLELRYRAERSPTVVHRFALASRLIDKQAHGEAQPLLEAILTSEPGYCPALHALAQCHLACGDAGRAVPVLQRLIERDRRWSDYRAWRTLIDALDALAQPEAALAASRDLVKMMPTLENQCHLAERLLSAGHKRETAELLDGALQDLRYAAWSKRWRNLRWSRMAQRLLKEAET